MTQPTDQPLTVCPSCGTSDVYRRGAHNQTTCTWFKTTPRYCSVHNEILRPDEIMCPTAGNPVADEINDPHERDVTGGPQ